MKSNHPLRLSLTLLVVASLLSACKPSAAPAETKATQTPVNVEVMQPRPVAATEVVRSMGRLETAEETTLSFKSPGVIADISVDIGDQVEAGQILARLESTELESARARALESLNKADRDLHRTEELYQRGVLPKQAVDDANTAKEIAAADLASAEFNLSLAEIRATASGRVLQRLAEPHEIVAPGAPILKVSGDTRDWVLRIDVSDRHVVRMTSDVRAWVHFDALPSQEFEARVARISAEANPNTAMFRVEFLLIDSDARLRNGMLGTAFVELENDQPGFIVPVASLVDANRGRAKLYIADKHGTAQLREVSTGKLSEDGIVVTGGLNPDDFVIVRGASFVDSGSPVNITRS